MDSNLTVNSDLLPVAHNIEHQTEHHIDKITFLEACHYGMAEKQIKYHINIIMQNISSSTIQQVTKPS